MNDFKPNIVIFSCNFCAPLGADRLLASQLKDNFNPRIIKTNCTGRVDPTFILDAFAKGADGVMVVGDRPGDCHFVTGNYKAKRHVKLLKKMLPQLGIEPDRLEAQWVTSETPKFLSSLDKFVNTVTSLGPLKVK